MYVSIPGVLNLDTTAMELGSGQGVRSVQPPWRDIPRAHEKCKDLIPFLLEDGALLNWDWQVYEPAELL
jgi:hypothetical protein